MSEINQTGFIQLLKARRKKYSLQIDSGKLSNRRRDDVMAKIEEIDDILREIK